MDRPGALLEVGTIAALGIHNLAVHRTDAPFDDVLNIVSAVGLTVGARRNGIGWEELGLDVRTLPRGVAVGAAAGALCAAAVALAASNPSTRRFFHDERVMDADRKRALYHSVVRIPAATALSEEVLFRGVLLATIARRRSPSVAGLWSSALFGLWHILPTIRTFGGNPAGSSGMSRGRAIAASVAVTSLAGRILLALRRRSDSLAAPILAHAALNSSAYLIGRAVVRRAGDSPG